MRRLRNTLALISILTSVGCSNVNKTIKLEDVGDQVELSQDFFNRFRQHMDLGYSHYFSGNLELAEEEAREAGCIYKEWTMSQFGKEADRVPFDTNELLGDIYAKRGEIVEALKYYKEAARILGPSSEENKYLIENITKKIEKYLAKMT